MRPVISAGGVRFIIAQMVGAGTLVKLLFGLDYEVAVVAVGIGAAIAVLGGRLVPPIVPAKLPSTEPLVVDTPQRPEGDGVVLVVNPASGSGTGARVIDFGESRAQLGAGVERAYRITDAHGQGQHPVYFVPASRRAPAAA